MNRLKKLFAAAAAYPKWLWGFVAACIAALFLFGLAPVSLFLTFLTLVGCVGTAGNEALSPRRKLLLCTFMCVSLWLILFVLTMLLAAAVRTAG